MTIRALETYTSLGDRLTLNAPKTGYRGGIDPYLLAAFANGNGKVLDMGCGIGTIILALATRLRLENRLEQADLYGLDISQSNIDLAKQNAETNDINITLFQHDIKDYKALSQNDYDEILMNPPYFEDGHYFEDNKTNKQLSNHEGESGARLNDWIICANYLLKAKGVLNIIHRTERLDDILHLLKEKKFGAIEVFPIWPRQNTPSKLIIIRAHKGRKTDLIMHSGLILHKNEEKAYTKSAADILYNCSALKT